MVAEFESDLIKMRTREELAVARAAGKVCATARTTS
jgi:DNA invertase Pin-like site-specific DNA recombinase